jgi:hypothetical protein
MADDERDRNTNARFKIQAHDMGKTSVRGDQLGKVWHLHITNIYYQVCVALATRSFLGDYKRCL